MPEIEEHLVPETSVEEMQHRVLDAPDVKIDAARLRAAHPKALGVFTNEPPIVLRIAEPQVIPARARPLRHRVCLAGGSFRMANPVFCFCQRRLAGPGRFEI